MSQASQNLPSEERHTNNMAGIALIIMAVFMLTMMDVFMKVLRPTHPVHEVIFFRAAVGAPMILLIGAFLGETKKILSIAHLRFHASRSMSMGAGLAAFVFALETVPLSTLTAVAFATPMMMTILSIPFLGERVHMHRWAAIIVGFVGVLIIVRPGTEALTLPVILVLASTVLWSAGAIITRKTPAGVGPLTVAFWFMVFLMLGTAVPTVMTFQSLPPAEWLSVVGVGLCGALGQISIAQAYKVANLSVIAPFEYTGLLWAALADIFIFAAFPEAAVWYGSVLIVGSGLYIAHRERIQHKKPSLKRGRV